MQNGNLDERDKILYEACRQRYDGIVDDLIFDLRERLERRSYRKLKQTILDDIKRLERIKTYLEIDDFIEKRILNA